VATVSDPGGAVRSTQLIQLTQELRDAGAEAVSIGSTRVVAGTAFTDPAPGASAAGGGVLVGGTLERPPYVVRVIADAATVSTALDIPGGVRETLRQLGADLSVGTPDDVEVSALHVVSSPQYARPVTPSASDGGSGG